MCVSFVEAGMVLPFVLAVAGAGWLTSPGAGTTVPPSAEPMTHVEALAVIGGRVLGAARQCDEVDLRQFDTITGKLQEMLEHAATDDDELTSAQAMFQQGMAAGKHSVTSGATSCEAAKVELSDMEQALGE